MSIPVSTVVNVSIAIGAQFPARRGFGILLCATAEDGPISIQERTRLYNNIEGVTEDFPSGTEVNKCATAYFSQQPKPTQFKVGMLFPNGSAGSLLGGAFDDLVDDLNGISDGEMDISIDGGAQNLTGLDFTAALTLDDIANVITTDLSGATCSFDTLAGRFNIFSDTLGVASSVGFSSAPAGTGSYIGALLALESAQGGISGSGQAEETVVESLDAIDQADDDWYGLVMTKDFRDTLDTIDIADWIEARVKVFGNTTNDPLAIDSVAEDDIGSILKGKNLRRTITIYSDRENEYPEASILGRAFTVNFNQPNSTITLKFKQMPGITTSSNLTQNHKAVLDSKHVNALIQVGDSSMFAESFMADGSFFDEVHGVDWLQNAIETNVFGYLLTRTTKVAYTNKGVASIEQQLVKALDEAVRNGLIAPGETIDSRFLPHGYETVAIPVEEINQSDKEARFYGGLSFTVLGAGAIHGVQINGIFER